MRGTRKQYLPSVVQWRFRGQILPAGTYVFKLRNSDSYRHIVQFFNKDENHVFGAFIAIRDYRLHPSSKSIVNFHERAAGSPVPKSRPERKSTWPKSS
jgi:hypothetical protein